MSQSPSNKPKKSSVRHTRAVQRDQTKRPNTAPPDEQIQALLEEVIHPATFSQVAHFQQLGLRERVLTLPVMVAFVLSLLWRHLGSVREGVRVLNQEGVLWTGPMSVSPQATAQPNAARRSPARHLATSATHKSVLAMSNSPGKVWPPTSTYGGSHCGVPRW